MLARRTHNDIGQALPEEWISEYEQILTKTYADQCEDKNKKIEVFGHVYKNELLLGFSLIDQRDQSSAPYALLLSFEIDQVDQLKTIRKSAIDLAALFFDQYFFQKTQEYFPTWVKEEISKIEFYYKITRENFKLTLEADNLLIEH